MSKKFLFQPISFSWVALHPDPKGIIFFIGGAFFGTFPTVFYRHFLRCIFEAGYTIVAIPFRFTFSHWSVAAGLLSEQQQLRSILIEMARKSSYVTDIYQHSENYYWVGHSLGCKYLALLELMSSNDWQADRQCFNQKQAVQPLGSVTALPNATGIFNQRSLLIAPDISDTDSAIPKPIAQIVEATGLGVKPSRGQTLCLIERSKLFNLTALISFNRDMIAGSVQDPDPDKSDVRWLLNHLSNRSLPHAELSGKHLEPLGIRVGNWLVDLNPWDKFAKPLQQWKTAETVLEFLEKLAQR